MAGSKRGAVVVVNERTGKVLATEMRAAESFWDRFAGLMMKKSIPDGFGLMFKPARGIHTHFMRFPIDLIFIDQADRVVKVRPAMRPWRFDFSSAAGVIEMNAGSAASADLQPGDQLRFETGGAGAAGSERTHDRAAD